MSSIHAVAKSNRYATDAVGHPTIMSAILLGPAVVKAVNVGYFPRNIGVAADDATPHLTDSSSALLLISATTVD